MTTIRLRFPASRYHATAWGRHVNEGVPEWPPSPYRLCRALFDVWKRKCFDLPESDVESALSALANSPPIFELPVAAPSHTRSYLAGASPDITDKSLVFDAFVAFDRRAACYMTWPDLTLSSAQREVLIQLLEQLNYLGRSESWVEADLFDGTPEGPYRCAPVFDSDTDGEMTAVACLIPKEEYRGKQTWLDALTTSTSQVIRTRASSPPILRRVQYVTPEGAMIENPAPKRSGKSRRTSAVLLSLHGTVLPLTVSTIEIAEQIRVRLMGAHKARMDGDESKVSPLFSGKQNGTKRLDHGHIFILPAGDEKRQRIDRIWLISRLRPFERDELDAIAWVRELWQSEGRPTVRVVATWHGEWKPQPAVGLTAAQEVVSATPFVTVRHTRRGRELSAFLTGEVCRECKNHGLPEPVRVEFDRLPGPFEAVEFRRNRKDDPPRPGYAFRILFPEPVLTPFSLGYGSHFGLGQFLPVIERPAEGQS